MGTVGCTMGLLLLLKGCGAAIGINGCTIELVLLFAGMDGAIDTACCAMELLLLLLFAVMDGVICIRCCGIVGMGPFPAGIGCASDIVGCGILLLFAWIG